MDPQQLKSVVEALLFASNSPLDVPYLVKIFESEANVDSRIITQVLASIEQDYADRGIELRQVASGYSFQVRQCYAAWVNKLWEEKPAKFSKALLETLAIIAYRQPVTRADIEDIRGVAVSTNIIRTLLEREWVRVVGHRDVPGKPAIYATTKQFLDYFNLTALSDLPSLRELKAIDTPNIPTTIVTDNDQEQALMRTEELS